MIIKCVGIAVIGGVLCFLLSEMGSRLTRPVAAITVILIFLNVILGFSDTVSELDGLLGDSGISSLSRDVMKILGAGYVFGVSADTLETLGEGGISRGLDTACRVEILLITLPYIKEIVAFGLSLIQ